MKKTLLLLAMAALVATNCIAQKLNYNITFGVSVPVGNFGAISSGTQSLTDCGLWDEEGVCGGAQTGFDAGVQLLYPFKETGLSFTFSADLHYNMLTDQARSCFSSLANGLGNVIAAELISYGATTANVNSKVAKNPVYLNVPILLGVRYTYDLGSGMSTFLDAAAGVNLRYITRAVFDQHVYYTWPGGSDDNASQVIFDYSSATTFAFRAGAGVNITPHISLAFYYYYLGKSDVYMNLKFAETEQYGPLGSVKPQLAVFKLGVNF